MSNDGSYTSYIHYGEQFFKQGRPEFDTGGCVTLCLVIYKYTYSSVGFSDTFIRKSYTKKFPFFKTVHAEELVLSEVKTTEDIEDCKAIRLELYSSFSPCNQCCASICQFVSCRPLCKVYIAFSCLYRSEDVERSALRDLVDLENVRLFDVFTVREWRLLHNRGFLYLSPAALNYMQTWDHYWRFRLNKIVSSRRNSQDSSPYNEDSAEDGTGPSHSNLADSCTEEQLKEMDKIVYLAKRRRTWFNILWWLKILFVLVILLCLVLLLIYLTKEEDDYEEE